MVIQYFSCTYIRKERAERSKGLHVLVQAAFSWQRGTWLASVGSDRAAECVDMGSGNVSLSVVSRGWF